MNQDMSLGILYYKRIHNLTLHFTSAMLNAITLAAKCVKGLENQISSGFILFKHTHNLELSGLKEKLPAMRYHQAIRCIA